MRPVRSHIPGSVGFRGQVNTSATAYREVEIRRVADGEIQIGS